MQLTPYPQPRTWANACARRHRRVPFSVSVKFHHLRSGMTWTSTGMTLDLSQGGFGALVNRKLSPGETLEVELALSNSNLRLIAIVRYCSSFGCGLEFLGLTPEECSVIAEVTAREPPSSPSIAKLLG